MFTLDQYGDDKYHSNDRVFTFEPIEGMKSISSTGFADPRLFTGENKLHAIKDPQTGLWALKYEKGMVPPLFKQKFTGFNAVLNFATDYFSRRGFKIIEVEDEPKNS